MAVVSDLTAEFAQLLSTWRNIGPNKFRNRLEKLRNIALEPYLQDPIKFRDDITLINVTYTHIIAYVNREVDPMLVEYERNLRKQRMENVEWAAKGVSNVAYATAVGAFKQGIPAS